MNTETDQWASVPPNTSLTYIDNDGVKRELSECGMTVDKAGRYWMWSKQLGVNLAFRERSREACLLSAINSLLFTTHLRDEKIAELQRIADLATAFADAVKPDEEGPT
jgi:hypothetical protein